MVEKSSDTSIDILPQAAVDKLLSLGVVSRVDLDETEGKKRQSLGSNCDIV